MIQKLILLGLAGALGTLARYGAAGLVHRVDGVSFPWGTLVVNLLGCFLAGLFWAMFEGRWVVSSQTRLLVLVGFMGGFTTFSGYILETGELLRATEWFRAGANFALQNGLGLIAVYFGVTLGRSV